MISTQDRRDAVTLIDEAMENGARLFRACAELELCPRTYRRWTVLDGAVKADGRPRADRPLPANALSEDERQKLVALSASPNFPVCHPLRSFRSWRIEASITPASRASIVYSRPTIYSITEVGLPHRAQANRSATRRPGRIRFGSGTLRGCRGRSSAPSSIPT